MSQKEGRTELCDRWSNGHLEVCNNGEDIAGLTLLDETSDSALLDGDSRDEGAGGQSGESDGFGEGEHCQRMCKRVEGCVERVMFESGERENEVWEGEYRSSFIVRRPSAGGCREARCEGNTMSLLKSGAEKH